MGHLDLKFTLQPGCSSVPPIEVTLYRAVKSKPPSSTLRQMPSSSESVSYAEFDSSCSQLKCNPVSNEFLRSINAVAVCGPLELGSNLDLSGQGGNVVMTSPSLILSRGRNFYLHIRAKSVENAETRGETSSHIQLSNSSGSGGSKENKTEKVKATPSTSNYKIVLTKVCDHFTQHIIIRNRLYKRNSGISFCHINCHLALYQQKLNEELSTKAFKVKSKPVIPKLQGSTLALKFSKEGHPFYFGSQFSNQPQPKTGIENQANNEGDGDKRKEYQGCDWLHEVSISVRKVKLTSMPLEE